MLNSVQLIGNLGKDPELKQLPSGDSIANLTIATSEVWKDKKTGQKQEKTEWHRVSYFGPVADICGRYLKKGSKVYVSGSIHTRKWQDNDGQDRYSTEIKGREMKMLDSKPPQNQQQSTAQPAGNSGNSGYSADDFDIDVPF